MAKAETSRRAPRKMVVRLRELLDRNEIVLSCAAGRVGRVVAVAGAQTESTWVRVKLRTGGYGATTFDSGDPVRLRKSDFGCHIFGERYWYLENK